MGQNKEKKYSSGMKHKIPENPVHILTYITYDEGGREVPEHSLQAETRRREIEDESGDHYIFVEDINTFEDLKKTVEKYSKFGPIREFALWSHSGKDGPGFERESRRSSQPGSFSGEGLHPNQPNINQWANLGFNWAPLSFATFYGCTTAWGKNRDGSWEPGPNPEVPLSETSFAYAFLESYPDLFAAAGQPWTTMPSSYKTAKTWEPGEYEDGEPVYSVAWQGDDDNHGEDTKLGKVYNVQAALWKDQGFKMRLFYKEPVSGEENVGVVRNWPNITESKVEECWARSERAVVATGG